MLNIQTLPADLDQRPFPEALARAASIVQDTLSFGIGPQNSPVTEAMAYAVEGGKGLRGFLALESARVMGIDASFAAHPAAAIEAIHAYSLVHDDLPCMDDDDLRRGQPTVHRKWDEATAVLAGDALHSLAFELIALTTAPPSALVDLTRTLAVAAGARGMVGGQAADIAAESADTPWGLDEITEMQAGKTGALLTWSCLVGPRMADKDTGPLERYGDALGLAFQIWDDVLDVEGDAAEVGKAVGKDAAAGKATFVDLLGLDGAKARARDLIAEAHAALDPYGDQATCLKDAASFVIDRRK
ncbi:MAG: polyprenyl synthetase family protein [Shimia sp.]